MVCDRNNKGKKDTLQIFRKQYPSRDGTGFPTELYRRLGDILEIDGSIFGGHR